MQLSKRLQLVASFVSPGLKMADVGTDHGYIPIYLVKNGLNPYAYACDVNKGPLQRADEHIRMYGLQNQIETRLGSGLTVLEPGEAESILIAGMGGPLMERLLEERPDVTAQVRELVLSPHSEVDRLRRYLHRNGFRIIKEAMVIDDGKFYTVIKAVHGAEELYTENEYRYGKYLLDRRDEVLADYLADSLRKLQNLKDKLSEAGMTEEQDRMKEVAAEIQTVQQLYGELRAEE